MFEESHVKKILWELLGGRTLICVTGHLLQLKNTSRLWDRLLFCLHFLTLSESELMHFLSPSAGVDDRTEREAASVCLKKVHTSTNSDKITWKY